LKRWKNCGPKKERETERLRRADLENLNKGIGEVRKGLDPIPDLKKGIQARVDEDFRLVRLIEETDQKITEYKRSDEEYKRALRILEEAHRADTKRPDRFAGRTGWSAQAPGMNSAPSWNYPLKAPASRNCASVRCRPQKANAGPPRPVLSKSKPCGRWSADLHLERHAGPL